MIDFPDFAGKHSPSCSPRWCIRQLGVFRRKIMQKLTLRRQLQVLDNTLGAGHAIDMTHFGRRPH